MQPKFIKLSEYKGWIRTDRVAAIRHAEGRHAWLLFDAEDRLIGEAAPPFDPSVLNEAPVVLPAVPGETATVLHVQELDHRPERSDLVVAKCALIAWRVHGTGWAEPVLIGDSDTNGPALMLVRRPDGRLADPFGSDYANLAEATTAFLKIAQQHWDRGGGDEDEEDEEANEPARVH
jgi:hypothetical protein